MCSPAPEVLARSAWRLSTRTKCLAPPHLGHLRTSAAPPDSPHVRKRLSGFDEADIAICLLYPVRGLPLVARKLEEFEGHVDVKGFAAITVACEKALTAHVRLASTT